MRARHQVFAVAVLSSLSMAACAVKVDSETKIEGSNGGFAGTAQGGSSQQGGTTAAGTGGTTAAGAGGTTAAGAGGATAAGAGGATAAGAGGATTAGAGGATAAGAGGTTAAGAGGTTAAGAGGATAAGAAGSAGATAGAAGATTAGAGGSSAGAGGTAGAPAGGSAGAAGAAAGAAGAGGSTSAPTCFVRFANLICDVPGGATSGTGFDVCFAAAGGSFTGVVPYFGVTAGDPGQFYYPGVTTHIEIEEGQYTVRVVPEGSQNCDTLLDPVAMPDQPMDLTSVGIYTVVFEGKLSNKTAKMQVMKETRGHTASGTGYQAVNALTDSPAGQDLNFCLQSQGGGLTTVIVGIEPLLADKSATEAAPSSPHALMFLANGDTTPVGRSTFRNLSNNDDFMAFVSGSNVGATGYLEPWLISCLDNMAPDQDPILMGTKTMSGSCEYCNSTYCPLFCKFLDRLLGADTGDLVR